MVKEIEVNGDSFVMTGEPSMGTVKFAQELQISILQDYIDNEKILQMDTMGNDEIMEAILDSQGGIENLKDMMWENQLLETAQTIMLAADQKMDLEEFETMPALQFKELKEAAEEAIGTKEDPKTAADFMEDLGIGMSSQVKELQEEAQEELSESDETSQEPLLKG